MENILENISQVIEFGKVNAASPFPPELKGKPGADELTAEALRQGISPSRVLTEGLIDGMQKIGAKFRQDIVFVPQVLMSARAMSAGMNHLKTYFNDGTVERRGKFIIGTVEGDLHDIGKNLVAMMVEGSGYEVIDLGVNVKSDAFLNAIKENPGAFVGMSALLTTTMVNMEHVNRAIKEAFPSTITFIGGAPVSKDFATHIKADYYAEEPQGLVDILNELTDKNKEV